MSDVTPNPECDPEDSVTGDEPATGPQRSLVTTLGEEADHDIDADELTEAQASQVIDRLQEETGRGGIA